MSCFAMTLSPSRLHSRSSRLKFLARLMIQTSYQLSVSIIGMTSIVGTPPGQGCIFTTVSMNYTKYQLNQSPGLEFQRGSTNSSTIPEPVIFPRFSTPKPDCPSCLELLSCSHPRSRSRPHRFRHHRPQTQFHASVVRPFRQKCHPTL